MYQFEQGLSRHKRTVHHGHRHHKDKQRRRHVGARGDRPQTRALAKKITFTKKITFAKTLIYVITPRHMLCVAQYGRRLKTA